MGLKLTNDLEFKNGQMVMISGAEETAQRIRHRLLTFRGEWFLDLSFGPTYRKDVLIKNPRLDVVTAVIKSEILKSVDDGSFANFSATLSGDRKLSISYTLLVNDEEITDTVTL